MTRQDPPPAGPSAPQPAGSPAAPPSARRPARRRSRAARNPLPPPVLLLAVLGACAIVLPFVGLGTRVAWNELPTLLASTSARAALDLSLRTCLIATAISVGLGVPLALLLARDWPGVRVGRVMAVLPMTMPPVVAGIALLSTLGRRGVLGPSLEAAGIRVSFSTLAVVIAQVFVSMPYLVVTLEAALRSRDTRLETIARTLGAREWRVLTRITLPLVGPALARGTALALGRSLGEFGATIAFAGSKEGVTRTMPLAIYLERESDTATSLALAVVLIALSFLIVGATSIQWGDALTALRARRRPDAPDDESIGAAPSAASAPAAPDATGGTGTPGPPRPDEPAPLRIAFASTARDVVVDLTVEAGRTLALVGPNGSGKSTACAVAAGLLDAEAGRVSLGERVLDGPGAFVPAGRRDVALLSQAPGIFPHMSVLDNVAFGPRCRGASRARARRRARAELAAVGASHLAPRPGGELSGGQAARVALARALAARPRALVLDEPMAALDVTARAQMRSVVGRRAAEEGLTVLLVTHDVLDVAALADDVAVLQDGRVVESGPAARVLAAPVSDFAARLTGTAVLLGALEGDRGAPRLRLASGGLITGRPQEADDDAALAAPSAAPAPPPGPAEASSAPSAALSGPGAALVPPDAVALYPVDRDSPSGSPRNALTGRVTGVERAGALVTVALDVGGGQVLTSAITTAALAELGVREGQELRCVIKAVQVRILARPAANREGGRE
ncbi:ATP-binding cassette domain-containing protein [Actinomyces dentalis]|uniref:ATP-binding cassette domain-containing protein n=1 Tax=Actinomyces dentalis TaxID=272548 RepID=UPI000A00D105|nr:ATP-binding cassette domain-containing protein [Actinomyces dentalis]